VVLLKLFLGGIDILGRRPKLPNQLEFAFLGLLAGDEPVGFEPSVTARGGQDRVAELYQAGKLYELLPSGPNELWQMDVTYVHIPGYGWWYAVTGLPHAHP